MPYTKQEKIELLKSTKRIYMIVINECKLKLPMLEMTYPESICKFNSGKPNYKYTIEMCMKSIGNITKIGKGFLDGDTIKLEEIKYEWINK